MSSRAGGAIPLVVWLLVLAAMSSWSNTDPALAGAALLLWALALTVLAALGVILRKGVRSARRR